MSQWMKSQHLKQKMHNMTQSKNLEALSRKHQLKVTRSTRFKNSSHSCAVYNKISCQIIAYWSVLYELCQILRQIKNLLAQNVAWMLKPWCNFLEFFFVCSGFPETCSSTGIEEAPGSYQEPKEPVDWPQQLQLCCWFPNDHPRSDPRARHDDRNRLSDQRRKRRMDPHRAPGGWPVSTR